MSLRVFVSQVALGCAALMGVIRDEKGAKEQSDRSSQADERLMRRIAGSDENALAELYDRRIGLVFSLACRILERQSDAEEIAQDVFTDVWTRAGRYDRRRGTVAAWLLIMTRSRSLDRLRARRARPDSSRRGDDQVLATLPATVDDAERRLLDAADVNRLRAALSALSSVEREAIELAYFGGLSQTGIAERLQQPLGTVKTRVRTGLMRLRAALTESRS